ncbi:MAG: hypothetical protein PVSMB7_06830 [Chloroflexota bacterium]
MIGRFTYIVFEITWALPVLAVQWLVGWRVLWLHRRLLLVVLGIATVYLSIADGIAIASGIWTLHRNRILGVCILDVPLEEVVFFLATNAMVAQSIILLYDGRPHLSRLHFPREKSEPAQPVQR